MFRAAISWKIDHSTALVYHSGYRLASVNDGLSTFGKEEKFKVPVVLTLWSAK